MINHLERAQQSPRTRWVLEPQPFDGIPLLCEAIRQNGDDFSLLSELPFETIDLTTLFDEPLFFYGSLETAKRLGRLQPNITVFCNLDRLKCSYYFGYLSPYLINFDYRLVPLREISYKFETMTLRWECDSLFVRPDRGDKPFTGGVFSCFDELYEQLGSPREDQLDQLVVVVRPQKIKREWRFIVSSGEVLGYSLYHDATTNIDPHYFDRRLIDLCREVLGTGFEPDPLWTLDLAETEYGIGVVEANSFSCAGLYEEDLHPGHLDRIVEAVNRAISSAG